MSFWDYFCQKHKKIMEIDKKKQNEKFKFYKVFNYKAEISFYICKILFEKEKKVNL